ncbi:MAG: sigma 54-interacting transcriptional regulator [Nitrospirota bacterium]|jgi:two-component system response regulator HydG
MKKKILVVDDEEGIRLTFGDFLIEGGYEVAAASSLTDALEHVREKSFDIFLVDIILPDGSGVELLKRIKGSEPKAPVIMITGEPGIETASEAVRLGAYDYIAKPVRKDTLLRVARTALRYKESVDREEKYRLNMEAIFRSVRDGIITVDKNMQILQMNEAASALLGVSREKAWGGSLEAVPSECQGIFFDVLRQTLSTRKPVEAYRLEARSRKGKTVVLSLQASPLLDASRNVYGGVLVVRDETRLCILEDERSRRTAFGTLVGGNEEMQKIYNLAESLADVKSTVLITGESGTGKGMVAEAIHALGVRSEKPFVKVNCAALPDELLESELFGHVKGAFTDAHRDRAGRFEQADGGTIFLDEIGDISPRMQLRLLRVLQEGEFERLGDSRTISVDMRVLAATNRNLLERVKKGTFREDLYYRINVVEIRLPSLRDRRDDIPLLVSHFLEKLRKKMTKDIVGITPEALSTFVNYDWPGNVRELEHALEHAFVVSSGSTISSESLPPFLGRLSAPADPRAGYKGVTVERMQEALREAGGNKTMAARLLGVDRRTVYRKMQEYGLTSRDP